MNRQEAALVLVKVQAYDNRQVGEVTVDAWAEALNDITVTDALEVVAAHYRSSREWIMPADVGAKVRAAHNRRLLDVGPPEYPNGLTRGEERTYRQRWQRHITAGATRDQATARTDVELGIDRGVLVTHPVAALLASAVRR